jgi:beta-glucosidase
VDGNVGDRNNLTAWHGGDDLVLAVAQNCSSVVVAVHSVDALIIAPWVDHPNVTATLFAGLPGHESGNTLVDILYGDYNPSARLPYTIAKDQTDYLAQIVYAYGYR